MSIFDISARVTDHIQRFRERARKSTSYVLQLPRDVARPWPPELIAYWRALGDRVGTTVTPIRPPEIFQSINGGQGLETRAVSIRPDAVLACEPVDLNIVLQRPNLAAKDRFDVVAGTNIFVYYDAFQQALALENIGAMLKTRSAVADQRPAARGSLTVAVRNGDAGANGSRPKNDDADARGPDWCAVAIPGRPGCRRAILPRPGGRHRARSNDPRYR